MPVKRFSILIVIAFIISCSVEEQREPIFQELDVLPSWRDGKARSEILQFINSSVEKTSENYIAPEDRIAVFDNDGTLWSEQPMYFQLYFVFDRIKKLSAEHPEWATTEPFAAVLKDDMPSLMQQGEKALLEIVLASHAGMTTEQFRKEVADWIKKARHPRFNKPFTSLVYQPMLELIELLRDNDYQVFIVSGGGIEFMRAWAEGVYGIPNDRVLGSELKIEYDYNDGDPVIRRLPEFASINDKEGKPVTIQKYIGRKPVFAVGNSDGDLQMLRWTNSNNMNTFKLYVHHTDSVREWAYDRNSSIGRLDVGLDEARNNGWTVIDMAGDWRVIYPFERAE